MTPSAQLLSERGAYRVGVVGIRSAIHRGEVEVMEAIDGGDVEMNVGNVETDDHHPYSGRREDRHLGLADRLGDHGEMGGDIGRKIGPLIDFEPGNH